MARIVNGSIIPWPGQDAGALERKFSKVKLGWVKTSMRRHEYFVGPGERRRVKSRVARKKLRKQRRKDEAYELQRELQRNGGS